MSLNLPKIVEVVADSNLVSQKELEAAVKTARHLKVSLADVLIGRNLVEKNKLGELLANVMGVNFVELSGKQIPKEILKLLQETAALERKVVPFALTGNTLSLAMLDPQDLEALGFVKKVTGREITPFLTFEKDIRFALRQYKDSLTKEFGELIGQVKKRELGGVPLADLAENVSIVEAVNKLLGVAVVERASDIHIESLPDELLVRYRIDGVLHDVLKLPKELHPAIIARVKILAGLKLDETRQPQDGRIKFKTDEGEVVSLRVSLLPAVEGEKLVMRILESGEQQFSLNKLGLGEKAVAMIKKVIVKPHGLILITGPTGSGKTTTLYTMLGKLNTSEVNISTIEDPVENRIRRVNQMQVNARIKLDFAKGLRALLRQDPDIILIGEIRDPETAKMAVNASMTGHLVMSTLHTNDAPGAIPRLIDLGVEPFLIASTLELVMAQRLVRVICRDCMVESKMDPRWETYLLSVVKNEKEREKVKLMMPKKLTQGKGCEKCRYTGYSGRVGIYEMFLVNETIREMILDRVIVSKVRNLIIDSGMKTILMDGLDKVNKGMTTIQEVLRVAFS